MTMVFVICEGSTEAKFVSSVLAPRFSSSNTILIPIIVSTKIVRSGPNFRGGITKYSDLRRDARNLLRNTSIDAITTMIDYYRLPRDFPGMNTLPQGSVYDKVGHLEGALADNLVDGRFHPYIQAHEFEALLFTDTLILCETCLHPGEARILENSVSLFPNPEHIDEGPNTSPAKRIKNLIPGYQKTVDGIIAAQAIGLARMRETCPHFNDWVTYLESFG
jgi:uncharacterized protein DUF4276